MARKRKQDLGAIGGHASPGSIPSIASQAPGDPQTPTPSPEPPADEQGDASGPDSHAAPTQEPASTSTAAEVQPASTQATGNVPLASIVGSAADLSAARACVRDRLMKHEAWPNIIETVRNMRKDKALAGMTTEARELFIWGQL